MTDIEIARNAKSIPILELAQERLGIASDHLEPYGRFKAKLGADFLRGLHEDNSRVDGKLVLVTAITPTPAGEGKTTTTVGLGDALNRIGKKTLICLREPSLGPCFGMKGGAAGGGRAQVVPMEDINLHFTGDFHAISLAHNLLASLIDNHIHQGNALNINSRRIVWNRVVDLNDRSLRHIVTGLGSSNGFPREESFDIVAASEVMAILCLATDLADLKTRLGNIIVAYRHSGEAVRAHELNAHGAMTVLLRDALQPNLVQTLENNPAFVHGGPFANIAHGCNSVVASKAALKLADYVITEAGFGADLGAEKFVDIKCRKAGLRPDAAVLVATIRALKYHGGVAKNELDNCDVESMEAGLVNLLRHHRNIRERFGLSCVVCINRFVSDSEEEIAKLRERLQEAGIEVVLAEHWAHGGAGAEGLAHAVVAAVERGESSLSFSYEDDDSLWDKIESVARKVYDAVEITATPAIKRKIKRYQENGFGHFPVCIAKTQYSFSSNAKLRGAPSGHSLPIADVKLSAGAEFLVVKCGDIMTMPGLPKVPAAHHIDFDEAGNIVGLF